MKILAGLVVKTEQFCTLLTVVKTGLLKLRLYLLLLAKPFFKALFFLKQKDGCVETVEQ